MFKLDKPLMLKDWVRVIGDATDGFCEHDGHSYFIAGMGGWTGRLIGFRQDFLRNGFVMHVRLDETSGTPAEMDRLRKFSPGLDAWFRPHNLEVITPLDLMAEV